MSSDRHIRQTIVEGWDQSKLQSANVAVIGDGPLAISTVMALSMIGFGDLNFFGNGRIARYDPNEFLYYSARPGAFKVEELERIIKKSNPEIASNPMNLMMGTVWNFSNKDEPYTFLQKADGTPIYRLVIDTTNDPHDESLLINWGLKNGVPVINGSAMQYKGEVKVILPNSGATLQWGQLSPDYHNKPQDPVMSGLVGGLIVEEARKIIMPLPGENLGNVSIIANFLSRSMVGYQDDLKLTPPDYDKEVWVIGDGSLGVHVIRALAQRGVRKIVHWDGDQIEELNLGRQFDYTLDPKAVGKYKADVLTDMVSKYVPNQRIVGKAEYFDGTMDGKGKKPDAIFRCTDSFKTSKMLNDFALQYNVPLFYGATSMGSGQAYAFIPGKNPCLEEVFSVSKGIVDMAVPAGCAAAPIPSVCTVNMITANAQMALFDIWCAGAPVPIGKFDYNNTFPGRLSMLRTDNLDCQHYKGG